jgi:hypothetical protein
VDAALHHQHGNAAELSSHNASGVSDDGSHGKVGDFGEGNYDCFGDGICQRSQPRAENDADER